jgi:hypothetical protein
MPRDERDHGTETVDIPTHRPPSGDPGRLRSTADGAAARAVSAAAAEQPDELAQLLDDVRRIADGIGGIQQLAVTVSARRVVDVGEHPTPSELSVVAALRECLDAARAGNDSHARVPRGLLRDAIWRLEDLTGAK